MASFVMRPESIQSFARGSEMVADLMRRGDRVMVAARAQVRRGHVRGGGANARGRGQAVTHINLQDSIVKRIVAGPGGLPAVRIGSDAPHAIFVHQGTAPHVIRPHDPNGVLAFPDAGGMNSGSASGSGMVFTKIVHHPGTRPNHFLTDNLHLAAE